MVIMTAKNHHPEGSSKAVWPVKMIGLVFFLEVAVVVPGYSR